MGKGLAIVLLAVVVGAAANEKDVVLSGTATDCFVGQTVAVRNLRVRALDPSTHQDLVNVLQSMDTVTWEGDGVEAMARFEPMYEQMVDLLMISTPLAQDTTTEAGAFSLSVPSSDTVLVIAQADMEDFPVYYAYRMVNARADATLELDMSHGQCGMPGGGQGVIQRTNAGLIFHDDFNRADGAPGSNWEIQGNAAFWSIAGNVLKGKPTNATLQQILVADAVFGAARSEMVVQARMRRVGTARTTFPGIHARHDSAGVSWFRWVVTNSGSASQDEFRQVLSGGTTILNTSSAYNANNVWQQFKLAVKDSQQQGWKDGVLRVNLTSAALNAVSGRAGLSSGWYTSTSDHHEYDDFAVYKRNTVTMSGLPAGYMLRVGTRVAVESAGTATVDLLEDSCPRPKVDVFNASAVLVAEHAPADGVWGGDDYHYTP